MRLPEVTRITGQSRSTIYRLIAEGQFPKAIKRGTAARWLSSEVDRWVADRVAASRQSHAA